MRAALLLPLLLVPLAWAQPSGAIDATIALAPDAPPSIDAPPDLVRLNDSAPGVRYLFDLVLTRDYTTFEVRANGFELDRPRQLVPSLVVPETEYPLFHDFPNERIWDVEGTGNVFHVNGTGDAIVLRLGVAGPRNVTLALAIDTTPPDPTIGRRENVSHFQFYQETRTSELALADLQIRKVGAQEWVVNPTPAYHVLQRFPIQGLDPATQYETRFVFVDWAGNEVTTPIERFTTAPKPIVPAPTVRIVEPAFNARVPEGNVTVRAAIESNESPVARDGIRFFFDKRELTEGFSYDGREVVYTPTTPLARGPHSVAVEATNALGGTGVARWNFHVGDADETPALAPAGLLVLLAALARLRRLPRLASFPSCW